MALTYEQASKIVQAAMDKASSLGIAVSIAVVDSGGHLVALMRMDGARLLTLDFARGKAHTAVVLQRETASLAGSPVFGSMPLVAGDRIIPFGGGIPIIQDGAVVAAVGVSGGTAEQDVECAQAGLATL